MSLTMPIWWSYGSIAVQRSYSDSACGGVHVARPVLITRSVRRRHGAPGERGSLALRDDVPLAVHFKFARSPLLDFTPLTLLRWCARVAVGHSASAFRAAARSRSDSWSLRRACVGLWRRERARGRSKGLWERDTPRGAGGHPGRRRASKDTALREDLRRQGRTRARGAAAQLRLRLR